MSLTTKISAHINARLIGTSDHGEPKDELSNLYNKEMATGTGSGLADKVFSDQRTLAASATESLDLAGGSLFDSLGAALTFVKVKAILIKAAVGNINDVLVGGAASNAFAGPFADASDIIGIKPGGVLLVAAPVAGWTVTAGTGDLLKIANSAGTTGVTYDITIIGTSA